MRAPANSSQTSIIGYVPDLEAKFEAVGRSQAIIEFQPDGTILTANPNFLSALEYDLDEVVGKHHSMFVDPAEVASPEYREFWAALGRGEFQSRQFRRITKNKKEIWIQASYNPVFDKNKRVYKVIKFATDITADKLKAANYEGQIAAIHKAQAVIEFKLDGTIVTANENFLKATGYSLDEICGKHHSMFVDPAEVKSAAYIEFWNSLARGEYQAGQYRRLGKGGKEVWIEASYNPIFDMKGIPYKVVKFATDVTKQKELIKILDKNLGSISQAMQLIAKQTSSASSGSTETTANVQAVASAGEELHASVLEISQTMSKSRVEADGAYEKVVAADEETRKLASAAQAMNGIVELIQDIAGQVNLLSLNATIEAARAGEAGKGFAVVATEVKNLAGQASEATGKISSEISGIQNVVSGVVSALGQIKTSIDSLRAYVTGVAGAVEEQSAVAKDMSSNMQSAATAVNEVNSSLTQIVNAVETVNQSVDDATKAAASLAK